jgi:phage head maturation protease
MTIEEIVKNKVELANIKKLATKHTDCVSNKPLKNSDTIDKAIKLEGYNDGSLQKVIANTYYWLDSHQDVHVKGTFTKSIKENINKIYHLDNHDSKNGFRSKVGNVKDIQEIEVKWTDLGVDKEGNTICVVGSTELIEDYNKQVYDAYKNGEIDQHSVGMIYLDMQLAVNDKQYPEEFKVWNEIYPLLGNQEEADKLNYFWVQKQAKLKEISCVLWDGSNALTPSIKQDIEVADTITTTDIEAEKSLQNEKQQQLLKELLNKF